MRLLQRNITLAERVFESATAGNDATNATIVGTTVGADYTYGKLFDSRVRAFQANPRLKLAKQGMSVVVIYFGFTQFLAPYVGSEPVPAESTPPPKVSKEEKMLLHKAG